MKNIMKILGQFMITICIIVITAFLMGIPISMLWNLFCPKVFGLTKIDFVDGAIVYMLIDLCQSPTRVNPFNGSE